MYPPYATMRSWLRHLAGTGRLEVARAGISLEFELAAVASRLDGSKACWFPQPGGHTIPLVAGFTAHRGWMAEAMGVDESGLLVRFRQAVEQPLKSKEVPGSEAPVQRVVQRELDIRTLLPIPRHNEHDSAPYITAGLVIARNPKTGIQNVSINRIQVNAARRMAILMLPRHLMAFYRNAEAQGEAFHVPAHPSRTREPEPVAICDRFPTPPRPALCTLRLHRARRHHARFGPQ